MANTSEPQFAMIEQPAGCKPPVVHCPICGNRVIDPNGGGATPCEHLAFIFVGEVSEFEYRSEDFQEATADVEIEDLSTFEFQEYLTQAGFGNTMLALQITYGSMACGPAWFTDIFGFDYESLKRVE